MRSLRLLATVALAALAALSAACAAAPRQKPIPTTPVASGPTSLQGARKFLEGRWSLISFDVYPPGKKPISLKGSGLLTYDDFGNLTMELRADQTTSDLLDDAGIRMQDGVLSMKGRTVIDLQNKTLTYVMEGQPANRAPTGPLDMNRPRHWQVDGDILTLTTQDDSGQPLSVGKWQREKQ